MLATLQRIAHMMHAEDEEPMPFCTRAASMAAPEHPEARIDQAA